MSRPFRQRRSTGGGSAQSMAGWLFADLLLVLFVVGLGVPVTQLASAEPPPPPPAEAAATEAPVMRQEPTKVEVSVNQEALLAGDPAELQRLEAEIAEKTVDAVNSQAVLVLIFGYSPDPNRGVAISGAVAPVIKSTHAPFTPQTQTREFWDGEPTEGTVRLEIFLLDNAPA